MMKQFKYLVSMTLFSFSLFAEEEGFPPSTFGGDHSYGKEFVNMLITLAFILVIIMGTVWFLKRLMRTRLSNLNKSAGIKILERRSLNQKSSLYLVQVLNKGVLISESPAGIQPIMEFPPETDLEALLEEKQKDTPPAPFSLNSILQKKNKSSGPDAPN